MSKALGLVALLVCGCSLGPGNLQSRYASDLEARGIRRIAVLPAAAASGPRAKAPFSVPAGDLRAGEREAAELLARLLYTSLASLPGWQIVSESEAREVDPGPVGDAERIRRIGEMAYADAVMSGTILRFRQRVGDDWGARSPASVAFNLDLVDVRRGDVVWSARFDETQQSLSENFLGVFQIGERGLRWVSAEELASEGVRKAIAQLHQLLVKKPG